MSIPSGGWLVQKELQYIEEAAFGEMPTSPTFVWIGVVDSWDPRSDIGAVQVRGLGSEDIYSQLKGSETYEFPVEFFIQDSTFLKYLVNSQNPGTPTGTISASLAFLISILMDGTEEFFTMLGCRPRAGTLTGRPGEPLKASMNMVAREIPESTGAGPAGSSYATDPDTDPWNFDDGGADPITWGSVDLDCTDITVNLERNLESLMVMGSSKAEFTVPKARDITATFTNIWTDRVQYADLIGVTSRALAWILKSATSTITLSDGDLTRLDSFTVAPSDVIVESYSATFKTAAIT